MAAAASRDLERIFETCDAVQGDGERQWHRRGGRRGRGTQSLARACASTAATVEPCAASARPVTAAASNAHHECDDVPPGAQRRSRYTMPDLASAGIAASTRRSIVPAWMRGL